MACVDVIFVNDSAIDFISPPSFNHSIQSSSGSFEVEGVLRPSWQKIEFKSQTGSVLFLGV